MANIINEIMPFGSCDIERANNLIDEAGNEAEYYELEGETADYIDELINDCETKLQDIDVVACVYSTILRKAKEEIEEETGKDIENDYNVYVAGNYLATSLDSDKFEEVKELIKTIKEPTKFITWFFEEMIG